MLPAAAAALPPAAASASEGVDRRGARGLPARECMHARMEGMPLASIKLGGQRARWTKGTVHKGRTSGTRGGGSCRISWRAATDSACGHPSFMVGGIKEEARDCRLMKLWSLLGLVSYMVPSVNTCLVPHLSSRRTSTTQSPLNMRHVPVFTPTQASDNLRCLEHLCVLWQWVRIPSSRFALGDGVEPPVAPGELQVGRGGGGGGAAAERQGLGDTSSGVQDTALQRRHCTL